MNKATGRRFLMGTLAVSFAAIFTACQSTPTRAATELKRLQGHWEGEKRGGKRTVTITGNALRFEDTKQKDWYETVFSLPDGANPPHLRARIVKARQTKDVGIVVYALYRIEGDTLTLLGCVTDPRDLPKDFGIEPSAFNLGDLGINLGMANSADDEAERRYVLKKVPASGKAR